MASELTAQENQALSRIREESADAATEFAGAKSARQQLESQLSAVQKEMASPDGIASSQQFAEDSSRLRREIQVAVVREEEADTTRRRLSAQESQTLAGSARRIRTQGPADKPESAVRRTYAGTRRAFALRGALSRTHQTIARAYNQAHNTRVRELTAVNIEAAKRVKEPSAIRYSLFIGFSLWVDITISPIVTAAWATIIIGIIATIVLGIIMAIFGRVILGSHGKQATKQRKELEKRAKELERDIQVVRQEYRSFLVWLNTAGTRFPRLAARVGTASARVGRIAGRYNIVRYAGKAVNWVKKGWVKQTSEAIPVWNILPWWTIGAVASYLSHRGDWKESQAILAQYNEGKSGALNMSDTMYEARLEFVSSVYSDAVRDANYEPQRS